MRNKPGRHLAPIDLISFQSDKKLCVIEHLKEYLERTKQLWEEHSQLLISYVKPFKPVSKDTIFRWVKQVLESAGIDINKYSAHSSRAASTSSCKAKGLSLADIMKSAGWSNSSTLAKFYDKPVVTASANFGSVLLNPDTLICETVSFFSLLGNKVCSLLWVVRDAGLWSLMWLRSDVDWWQGRIIRLNETYL